VAKVVVEEAQRPAGVERLQPQADLAQLDGHLVQVNAIEAAADDIAQGVAAGGQPVGRGDEEVAGAGGGINDFDGEEGGLERGVGSREWGMGGRVAQLPILYSPFLSSE